MFYMTLKGIEDDSELPADVPKHRLPIRPPAHRAEVARPPVRNVSVHTWSVACPSNQTKPANIVDTSRRANIAGCGDLSTCRRYIVDMFRCRWSRRRAKFDIPSTLVVVSRWLVSPMASFRRDWGKLTHNTARFPTFRKTDPKWTFGADVIVKRGPSCKDLHQSRSPTIRSKPSRRRSNSSQVWPRRGQSRANLGRRGPNSASIRQYSPWVRPILANLGGNRANLGPKSPQIWCLFGQN